MEPPGGIPPDRDKISIVQQPNVNLPSPHQNTSLVGVSSGSQQTNLERLSRPLSFDKMEGLVREMQDPENGVPVRQQKMFLTSIPYAFMGYDLIEWLMDRLSIEESEALNIANQLCLHGYFFPVNDTKTLVVKDDSSLYRFQTPYYWPWQHKAPDNVEYAIYLAKRSLRNKQRHGLEDYETDALNSLHKNLKGKWDFISMQAEEQVRLAKERKKGDKIVSDSQERAYWRVHRPPPGQFTPLEPCPVPSRDRQGIKPKKKSIDDWQREVDYLHKSLNRTRIKMSQACESLVNYWETFSDYDFFIQPVLPSNPWVSEDTTFWQLNNSLVDIPTEKRVKRWAISIEELVSDPTGLQEFTNFLEKEYSHENIRFWIAVNKLRRSAHSQVCKKVNDIYEEFLKPGAPCEINIDGKTMEIVQKGLKNPSRFTFDAAAEHIYMLLLKKDCYPRFVRSEHYKNLLATGIQPSHKKRFFNFGGVAKKKTSTVQQPNIGLMAQNTATTSVPQPGNLARRRGSDRSLSGSAHELALIGTKDSATIVPHSHSQSNLSEIPYSVTVYRGDMPNDPSCLELNWNESKTSGTVKQFSKKINQEASKSKQLLERLEPTAELSSNAVCPWDIEPPVESTIQLSVCPWEEPVSPKQSTEPLPKSISTTSDIIDVSERMKRSCGLRQNTVDSDYSTKRLIPAHNEQRRSSMTVAPRVTEFQLASLKEITVKPLTSSPTQFQYNNKREFASKSSKDIENIEIENILPLTVPEETHTTATNICDETVKKATKEDKTATEKAYSLISTPSIQVVCPEIETTSEDNEFEEMPTNPKPVLEADEEATNIEIDETKDITSEEKLDSDGNDPSKAEEDLLLSTTEEYQEETELGGQIEAYECYLSDEESSQTLVGCVAPAPTPAPTLAPLAEIEMDAVDDETDSKGYIKPEVEEMKKKRRKRITDSKKSEEKGEGSSKTDEINRNAVCPWEDDDVSTSDGTFTKTYATLGYL